MRATRPFALSHCDAESMCSSVCVWKMRAWTCLCALPLRWFSVACEIASTQTVCHRLVRASFSNLIRLEVTSASFAIPLTIFFLLIRILSLLFHAVLHPFSIISLSFLSLFFAFSIYRENCFLKSCVCFLFLFFWIYLYTFAAHCNVLSFVCFRFSLFECNFNLTFSLDLLIVFIHSRAVCLPSLSSIPLPLSLPGSFYSVR